MDAPGFGSWCGARVRGCDTGRSERFYDVLRYPNGSFHKFRLRSLVGLIPFYALEVLSEEEIDSLPEFRTNFHWYLRNRQDVAQHCITTVERDGCRRYVLGMMDGGQMRQLLRRVWDPGEFRSEFGLRSLSKHHEKHPFVMGDRVVGYEPGESREPSCSFPRNRPPAIRRIPTRAL